MNDMIHERVQELLKEIFNNVNSWLAHAEAKNAAIIAFNVACLSLLWDMKDIDGGRILLYIVFGGMLFSSIMSMISFFPQTGKETRGQAGYSDYDNLIFYKDIAKYDKKEYIKAIYKRYAQVDIADSDILKLEEDFSAEITYNATVVIRKYKWFGYAVITEIVTLVILMFVVIAA